MTYLDPKSIITFLNEVYETQRISIHDIKNPQEDRTLLLGIDHNVGNFDEYRHIYMKDSLLHNYSYGIQKDANGNEKIIPLNYEYGESLMSENIAPRRYAFPQLVDLNFARTLLKQRVIFYIVDFEHSIAQENKEIQGLIHEN